MRETEVSLRNLARYQAQRIEAGLMRASVVAEMVGEEMEVSPKAAEAELNNYLGKVVTSKDFIYGSCIAFEPFTYDAAKKYVAPYYYWNEGKPQFVQLGNPEYDYFKWDWYKLPKQAGKPLWTEPYYDEGGGEAIMVTYSVPFRRAGEFWGIATIDIAMNAFTSEVGKIRVGKRGYAFAISKGGKFLSFPDKTQIMKGSLQDFDANLARKMVAGEDGFIRAKDPMRGGDVWTAFVPIKTGDFSLAIVYPAEEIMEGAFALQREILWLGGLSLLSLVAVLVFIVRSISKPITRLSVAAQRVAAGDLDVQLESDTRTREVSDLTDAFQSMTSDLKLRMEELRVATASRERLEGELQASRAIQMSILPRDFPALSSRNKISIHALIRPAREVGGDFYDFYFVDDEWLCVLIGDVSGKGIPAALYMAVTHTLLKAHTVGNFSPAEILRRTNRELCAQSNTGMFVTLFYGLLNVRTGSFVYCNAGHNPPYVISKRGGLTALSELGGTALGASADSSYDNCETKLNDRDLLFCFTDGVTEATGANGSFFTEKRLTDLLAGKVELAPDQLTSEVLTEVQAFAGVSEQADDITLLALKFCGSAAPANESPLLSKQKLAAPTGFEPAH